MGERLGHDAALSLALEAVVADRGGSVQAFLDVARLQDLPGALGVVRPDPGEAIRLQLHLHLERVRFGAAALALRLLDSPGDPEEVLHVVADLVRDDVRLGEVAGRTDLVAQVTVERQIDVDLAIAGTIEGADGRFGEAAGRLDRPAEQHEMRRLILPAHLAEELGPRVFGVGEDHRDEIPQRFVAGGRRAAAGRSGRIASRPDPRPAAPRSGPHRTTAPGGRGQRCRCRLRRRPHGQPACRVDPRCCHCACPSAIASLASRISAQPARRVAVVARRCARVVNQSVRAISMWPQGRAAHHERWSGNAEPFVPPSLRAAEACPRYVHPDRSRRSHR